MNKKQKFKYFFNGAIFALVLVVSTASFASSRVEKVLKVLYNDIKIAVDGKPVDLGKDLSGKEVEPFIYEGTTYLPVRAVGEAFNKPVEWDSNTKTVLIGEGVVEEEKHLMDEGIEFGNSFVYRYGTGGNGIKMGGNHYKSGIEFRTVGSLIQFNLDSKYTSLTGDLATMSHNNNDSMLEIYLDGKLYDTILVSSTDIPREVNVPLKNVNHLLLKRISDPNSNGSGANVGFGNILVK